ncbi:MAG: anti-sigma factor family protein, partial [Fidelibacterota bacterium]
MNCDEFRENISTFIDGEAAHSLKRDFLAHRDNCSQCSSVLEDVKNVVISLKKLNSVQVSRSFDERLKKRIVFTNQGKDSYYKKLSFIPGSHKFTAFAISFAVLSVLILVLYSNFSSLRSTRGNRVPSVIEGGSDY